MSSKNDVKGVTTSQTSHLSLQDDFTPEQNKIFEAEESRERCLKGATPTTSWVLTWTSLVLDRAKFPPLDRAIILIPP